MKSPSAGLVTLPGPSPNLKKSMVTVTEFLLLLKLKTTFYLKVHFMFHTSFGGEFPKILWLRLFTPDVKMSQTQYPCCPGVLLRSVSGHR